MPPVQFRRRQEWRRTTDGGRRACPRCCARLKRAVSQLGELTQRPAGGVLLEDEALDSSPGRQRYRWCRTAPVPGSCQSSTPRCFASTTGTPTSGRLLAGVRRPDRRPVDRRLVGRQLPDDVGVNVPVTGTPDAHWRPRCATAARRWSASAPTSPTTPSSPTSGCRPRPAPMPPDMAMGLVILNEFFVARLLPFFIDSVRRYTDALPGRGRRGRGSADAARRRPDHNR